MEIRSRIRKRLILLEQTLDEMREDGTSAKIIGKYLDDPEKYLEVDQLEEE